MARVWVYDRSTTKTYKNAMEKAKGNGRKPPGRWLVMYYDRAGKLKSEVSPNKARADDRRTELESSLSAGTYVDPASAKVIFADTAEKWLETRHDLRPSAWWKYRGLLDTHVLPKWGDLPLNAIGREDVEIWVAKLLKSRDDGGSGLGPSQARTRHAYRVLSMVLEWSGRR
jgi:hypothetical protein